METKEPRAVGDVCLAFFVASRGNMWDKLISLIDGSKFSHVELAVLRPDGRYVCYTSHSSDGGVRVKTMALNPKSWELYRVNQIDLGYALSVFKKETNAKYDWLGLISTKIKWFPGMTKRWFCSELIAAMLKINKPGNQGIKDMLVWAERNSQ